MGEEGGMEKWGGKLEEGYEGDHEEKKKEGGGKHRPGTGGRGKKGE